MGTKEAWDCERAGKEADIKAHAPQSSAWKRQAQRQTVDLVEDALDGVLAAGVCRHDGLERMAEVVALRHLVPEIKKLKQIDRGRW